MTIKPCPVCGKMPKIRYWDHWAAEAKCKPFLRKAHALVIVGVDATLPSRDTRTEDVIMAWNAKVAEMQEAKLDDVC